MPASRTWVRRCWQRCARCGSSRCSSLRRDEIGQTIRVRKERRVIRVHHMLGHLRRTFAEPMLRTHGKGAILGADDCSLAILCGMASPTAETGQPPMEWPSSSTRPGLDSMIRMMAST